MSQMLPYSFFNDVEKPLKYILYGDTDSDFVWLPNITIDTNDLRPTIDLANTIGKDINRLIEEHMKTNVLPKMGINPIHNRTKFKTEIIADCIFFIGIKKNYAYRLLVKEGNIIEHKPIKYTGLTTKSDMTKYTKQIINELIEQIMFNKEIPLKDKMNKATLFVMKFKQIIKKDISELNLEQIGQPKKWSLKTKNNTDTWQVFAMKLYNTIMDTEFFKPLSGGIAVPIIIKDVNLFLQKIDPYRFKSDLYIQDASLNKLKHIVLPYSFDKETVRERLNEYTIEINEDDVWEKICGQTIQDIMQLFNKYSNPLNQYISNIS